MNREQMFKYVANFATKVWPRSKYLVSVFFVKQDKWGGPDYDEWSILWKEYDNFNSARRQYTLWSTISGGWQPKLVLLTEKNKKLKSNWDMINAYPPEMFERLGKATIDAQMKVSGFTGNRSQYDYDVPFEQDENYEGFVGDEDMSDEVYRMKMFREFEDDFGAMA